MVGGGAGQQGAGWEGGQAEAAQSLQRAGQGGSGTGCKRFLILCETYSNLLVTYYAKFKKWFLVIEQPFLQIWLHLDPEINNLAITISIKNY